MEGVKRFPLITVFYGGEASSINRAGGSLEPALYWYNGVKWIKVGGTVDAVEQSISLRTKLLGRYSVQLAVRSGEFGLSSVEPKIFSPDEVGNVTVGKVRFTISNPDLSEVTVKIYDLEGHLVRTNLERDGEEMIYWDGKDAGGEIVRSGVYLYEIEGANKVITGTVVVAR
jgi:flagellar hook assembly protein FlgD